MGNSVNLAREGDKRKELGRWETRIVGGFMLFIFLYSLFI